MIEIVSFNDRGARRDTAYAECEAAAVTAGRTLLADATGAGLRKPTVSFLVDGVTVRHGLGEVELGTGNS